MTLQETICKYAPDCEQEREDRRIMLDCMASFSNLLSRQNELAHFTASAWVVNPDRTRVLMIYHNIYNSWAWTGGHADGEEDLLSVALREVREETGLARVESVVRVPFSLEILPVSAHFKRGKYVSPHLHLNLTYLLEASDGQSIRVKPDENSGVRWFEAEAAVAASSEPEMRIIYEKLNQKLRGICAAGGESRP